MEILIILILMGNITFMKMILKLLFMSDFWPGTINLNNVKHLKKKQAINFITIAWHSTIWWDWCMSEGEKRNRTIFY